MRSRLKNRLEPWLARAAEVRLGTAWGRSRRIVLAYHNVVPDDWIVAGDSSLHICAGRFRKHLQRLRELADVRPLADLVSHDVEPQERPWAAVTFDDAYQGALSFGLAEVVRQGMPATVFVAPGCLGGTEFWWDTLGRVLGPGFDSKLRHRALTEHSGDQESVLAALAPNGPRDPLPAFARAATADEVASAADLPGVSIAAHSWSHRNLARLDPKELVMELDEPLQWLRRFASGAPYLAYPYGLSNEVCARTAREAGYTACFRVTGGGWNGVAPPRFELPRLNVPRDLSVAGLTARIGGLR